MQGGQPRGVATLRLRLIRALPCRDVDVAGVLVSGQKRGAFRVIKRELRRRSAIKPVIGQMNETATSTEATSKAATVMPPTSSSPPIGHNLRLLMSTISMSTISASL
jgi:hypothetical protein